MKRVNLILAAATLGLAGASLHFARATNLLRSQNDAKAVAAGREQPAQPALTPAADVAGNQPGTTAAEASKTPAGNKNPDQAALALARHRLDELLNPQTRAQRLKELADMFSGDMASVAPHIGMTADELQRYSEQRAEQVLRWQQRLQECLLDPACDAAALRSTRQAEAKQEETAMLGPERSARLKTFQAAFYERNLVQALQKTLPAGAALPPAQAEKLALALAEETQKFDANAQRFGQKVFKYVSGNAVEVRSAAHEGTPEQYRQKQESAARHQQLLHARAASLLTTQQLAEFRTLQEQALARYQERLREEEIAANARGRAGP